MVGSAATTGVLAVIVTTTVALGAVTMAAAAGQHLAGAADAAALAAADAASGAVTGVPCERATEVADAHHARLSACELAELIATVTLTSTFAGVEFSASARAGPPS